MTALICATLSLAANAEPITLKGLAPGMTKGQLEEAHGGITSACFKPPANPTTTELCGLHGVTYGPLATFAGVTAQSYVAHVKDDVAHTITVVIASSDYEMAETAINERFGKPSARKVSTIKNRMGATFDQLQTTWTVERSILVGTKRAGQVDQSTFHLTRESDLAARQKQRKESAKTGAKDM